MTEALRAPERRSGAVSGPVTRPDGLKPADAKLDGNQAHVREDWCAPEDDWCPSWAVMGPAATADELAQTHLNGQTDDTEETGRA